MISLYSAAVLHNGVAYLWHLQYLCLISNISRDNMLHLVLSRQIYTKILPNNVERCSIVNPSSSIYIYTNIGRMYSLCSIAMCDLLPCVIYCYVWYIAMCDLLPCVIYCHVCSIAIYDLFLNHLSHTCSRWNAHRNTSAPFWDDITESS